MEKSNREKGLTIFSYIVVFLTTVLIIYASLHDLLTGNSWRVFIWLSVYSLSLFFYVRIRNISDWSHIAINIMIVLSIFGEMILGLYYTTAYYDKFLHFIIPLMIFFVANDFLYGRIQDYKKRGYTSLLIVICLVLLWECVEAFFYLFLGVPMVGVVQIINTTSSTITNNYQFLVSPIGDTIYDILFDMIGIFLAFRITMIRMNNKFKIKELISK